MDFVFTDEQEMIAETVQSFFRDNATSERTRKAMAADGIDRQLWQDFCQELGLGGVIVPEESGGVGLGHVELAIVAEAAGAKITALPLLGLNMAAQAIATSGSDTQQEKWLPGLLSGEVIAAGGGSAELKNDGDKLTGTVKLIPHGGAADLLVLAGTDGAWLVDASADGVTVQTHTTMDQTRPLATITVDGAEADPLPNWQVALAAANAAGWLTLSAEALGGAQEALDRTVEYAKEREQFGRPIGSFQAYKHRLADMVVEIEQARSAVYWAACAIDEKSDEVELALHAAKAFCADTFFKCAGDMIQLHGGIGFTWEHDAHLFFKRARSIQTLMLDGNWHRERIATMILGEAA